jgi:hypothetical protein
MADNGDMQAHEASDARMIGMIKWGTIATAIIAALVIWAIASSG